MKNSQYDFCVASQINLFDMMSATEKRIACAFAPYYKLNKLGIHKTSYVKHATIATKAKCSYWEVSRFVSRYEKFCFDEVRQQKKTIAKGHNLYGSNLYKYHAPFFDVVCFLKEKGWWGNWKKMRSFIVTQFNEDEEVTRSKLGYDLWLLNSQNANGLRSKTQTNVLKDTSYPSRRYKVPTNPPDVPDLHHPSKKTASEVIKVPGLSEKYKMHFDRFGSIFLAQEINKDYDFNVKYDRTICFPDKWVESRLKEQMQYQYKVLTGEKNVYHKKRRIL